MRPLPASMALRLPVHSRVVAAWLAEASALAYKPAGMIENAFLSLPNFCKFHFFSQAGTQAYLVEFEACQVLVFRGTQLTEFSDILTDLNFTKTKLTTNLGGNVHEGFFNALDTISDDIKSACRETYKPLYIAGHSLGGALAVLAGAAFAGPFGINNWVVPIKTVYTFGCPRVGDKSFAEGMQEYSGVPHYRYTNTADIVPWLPMLIFRYRHGGQHFHLTAKGQVIEQPGLWRHLASLALALIPGFLQAASWKNRLPHRLFSDHAISAYVRKLKEA